MYLMSPETQRILVEQRRQRLCAAFAGHRRSEPRPLRLVVRRRARRVFRRAATA
jgi:hypothetical protein